MKKFIFACLIGILVVAGCTNDIKRSEPALSGPEDVLKQYVNAITDRDYATMVELYGGDYDWLQMFAPESDRQDKEKIFESYIQSVMPEKISFNEIKDKKEISENEFVFVITFKNEDGTLFEVRTEDSSKTEFTYTVKRVDGVFKVMEPPPYQS